MPAARGVKRAASKSSSATTTTSSTASKNKKKRGPIQLDVPKLAKGRCRILTCGQGDVGQLGLGEDVLETTKFKYVASLGDKIVESCAGGMHTVALDSDGKVWTFGCNDEGALGRPTSGEADEATPTAVSLPAKAVAISAGDSHTAALLEDGKVYAWGAFRDSHGSMGLILRGREGKPCKEPVHIDIGESVVAIASGSDHLVMLGSAGGVYTMGCGEQGQLGRLAQRSASRDARGGFGALLVPGKVNLKSGVSRIWAGFHATFALDSSGEKLLAWGLNNYGQLGISGEKRRTALYVPTECDGVTSATYKSLCAGQHHTVTLDSNGVVGAMGRREYGRLGLGEIETDPEGLATVTKLEGHKCVAIAAGTANSFAVTDSGVLYSWGMGSEGQLGTGQQSDHLEPHAVQCAEGLRARYVSAGGQHTVLVAEDTNRQRSPSPVPEAETSEAKPKDKAETEVEEDGPEPPKKKKVEPVSSTTSASTSSAEKSEKVNGDEKPETTMEVDEIDNTKTTETAKEPEKTEDIKPKETNSDVTVTEPIKMDEDTPAPNLETKQDKETTPPKDEPKTLAKSEDVEMTEKIIPSENGTPDNDVITEKVIEKVPEETKTAEAVNTTA